MNKLKKLVIAALSIIGLSSPVRSREFARPPADAMRELRVRALSFPASDYGISKSRDFPRVYGVLIDFPFSDVTGTILSLSDGTSSLYTTSNFGVIGGESHEAVRTATIKLVKAADHFFDEAKSVNEYSYPDKNKVLFYLLSFDGTRVIEAEISSIESNQSKYSSLFWLGQEVLTQLRLTTQSR